MFLNKLLSFTLCSMWFLYFHTPCAVIMVSGDIFKIDFVVLILRQSSFLKVPLTPIFFFSVINGETLKHMQK